LNSNLNIHNIKWCIWNSHMYKSTKAYKVLINHTEVHLTFKWIWESSCQYKPIVFFCLLLKDRLAQESFSKGRTWISPLMIMSCAPNLWRKPWNTYFSSVTSRELASLVLILALTPMVNSLLLWNTSNTSWKSTSTWKSSY